MEFPERPEPRWLASVWMCADQRELRMTVRQMSVLCSGSREVSGLVKGATLGNHEDELDS